MDPAVLKDINNFSCTQCGGELHPDEGQVFITCPYCSSTVYLDKSRVVFHWYLASTINEEEARFNLHRWMSGNQTVKNLDVKAKLTGLSFEYFPVWYFKSKDKDNKEQIWLEPAAATSVSEIKSLRLPAGDLRKYDPALDSEARSPDIPHQTVTRWLKKRLPGGAEIIETSLVHIPLYTAKYMYKKNNYSFLTNNLPSVERALKLCLIDHFRGRKTQCIGGAVNREVYITFLVWFGEKVQEKTELFM